MSLTRVLRGRWSRRGFVAAALLLCASAGMGRPLAQEPSGPPVIAAASDLTEALSAISRRFTEETGRPVRLSFGSSGNLARQILQGAPFQMFLSADEAYVRQIAEQGKTLGDGTLYAVGRIVLYAPAGSGLSPDDGLRGLGAALADGRVRKFAIANPEHAPYGRAAREALTAAGLWEAVRDRLVLGENASQAAQFAASGSAQGGIIPYSLALAPALSERGSYALIPEDRHEPLRQRMVLLEGAGETARMFYDFLQTPEARAILERYGFALPAAG